jgi:hypothetical protein
MTAPDQPTGSTAVEAESALEAIDSLSEQNRRDRDPEIEKRLVRLRNLAYQELDRSPTESPWPDQEPRARDADEELPRLSRDEVTPELIRDQILRYGCAYIPGLVPRERAEHLADEIDRAFELAHTHLAQTPPDEDTPFYFPWQFVDDKDALSQTRSFVREGGGVWTVEAPRIMFDFLETLEQAGLRPLIRDYLGERPAMTLKKSTLRKTEPLPMADWHQDGAFLGDDIRTLNLWLSLSHCGDDAPGLDLVPRRFDRVLETGAGGASFHWSAGPDTVEEARGDVPVVRPLFEPGDALLFDELFLHRTATDDSMTRTRFAIETWFFAPSLYPGDQIPFVW